MLFAQCLSSSNSEQSASDGQHFTFDWPAGHFVPPGQQAWKGDQVWPQSVSVARQEPFLRTESPYGLLNISDIGSVITLKKERATVDQLKV